MSHPTGATIIATLAVLATQRIRSPAASINVKENPDHLKWLHTMISNAKAFIGGMFHGLAPNHLQVFLNEFCFVPTPGSLRDRCSIEFYPLVFLPIPLLTKYLPYEGVRS
jgi:hypothetical protein